jgi:predicted transcriptional regulator
MAEYTASFWEVATESAYLENLPAEKGLWFETEIDRERRYAFQDFFGEVKPVVREWIDGELTERQRQVVQLYFFHGKTQEDIATILDLTQSTVSRHLFGTVRQGKKVGGAIPKLRKVLEKSRSASVTQALGCLQERLAEAV